MSFSNGHFTISFVNMAKHMKSWFHLLDCKQKLFTTSIDSFKSHIQDTVRRSVCNKDISILRYLVPHCFQGLSSVKIESPIIKSWLPWTTIKLKSFNCHFFIA